MTFEPGKTYRTRDGREARVYAVGCGGKSRHIHGAVKEPDGDWNVMSWGLDGRWGCDSYERPNDLLPPAPPAPADEASRYAAAWRAGAEAMREAAAAYLGRLAEQYATASKGCQDTDDADFWRARATGYAQDGAAIRSFSLPTPPAAPAMTVTAETPAETDAAYRKLRGATGLSPEPERLSGWVNIYPGAPVHPTKAAADREAGFDRIACIDLSQHRKGEGL